MIKVKKLHENAQIPVRSSTSAAGLDIFTLESALIPAGQRALLHTGIAMAIPQGQVGLIWPRSKLASKFGLDVLAGVVDADYRGEVMVSLLNTSADTVEIKVGDKCAQMIVQHCYSGQMELVTELDETERGAEGVNSTEMRY